VILRHPILRRRRFGIRECRAAQAFFLPDFRQITHLKLSPFQGNLSILKHAISLESGTAFIPQVLSYRKSLPLVEEDLTDYLVKNGNADRKPERIPAVQCALGYSPQLFHRQIRLRQSLELDRFNIHQGMHSAPNCIPNLETN
jgi:hypothetical protein